MKYTKPAVVVDVRAAAAIQGTQKGFILPHETGSTTLYVKTANAYEADE